MCGGPTKIVNITRQKGIDLMVFGGPGHRGLLDLLDGQTISTVRHGLDIPVVAVQGKWTRGRLSRIVTRWYGYRY